MIWPPQSDAEGEAACVAAGKRDWFWWSLGSTTERRLFKARCARDVRQLIASTEDARNRPALARIWDY